jgi:hypothetical protein
MTNRYRAGQPCTPQMDCTSSGCNGPVEGECIGICSLHRIPHPKPLPVEMHEPDLSLRDKFLSIFKKPWGKS